MQQDKTRVPAPGILKSNKAPAGVAPAPAAELGGMGVPVEIPPKCPVCGAYLYDTPDGEGWYCRYCGFGSGEEIEEDSDVIEVDEWG